MWNCYAIYLASSVEPQAVNCVMLNVDATYLPPVPKRKALFDVSEPKAANCVMLNVDAT